MKMRAIFLGILGALVAGAAIAADGVLINQRYGVVLDLPEGWQAHASEDGNSYALTYAEHPLWETSFAIERQSAAVEAFDARFAKVMTLAGDNYRLTSPVPMDRAALLTRHGETLGAFAVAGASDGSGDVIGYAPGIRLSLTDRAARRILEQSAYQCGVFYTLKISAPVTEDAAALNAFGALSERVFLIARGDEEGCKAFRR
jgi:hypothetical protein